MLLQREAKDNEIAAQKGLKPYTLLNVEFNDGTDEQTGGYMGLVLCDAGRGRENLHPSGNRIELWTLQTAR